MDETKRYPLLKTRSSFFDREKWAEDLWTPLAICDVYLISRNKTPSVFLGEGGGVIFDGPKFWTVGPTVIN